MAERRYSLTPLVEAMRLNEGQSPARALGMSGTRFTTYAVNGVTEPVAERLALRAGFVPYEVWPEMLTHAIEDVSRTCAADDCEVTFVPGPRGGKNRRYCSPTCGARMHMRRYRQTETGKQKNREYVARYKAEAREAARRRAERKAA